MLELVGANDERIQLDARSQQKAIDRDYVKNVQKRLAALEMELEEARRKKDMVLVHINEREIEELKKRVRADLNLCGTGRDMNNPIGKLRSSIHGCLRRAYDALRAAFPPMAKLAGHFEAHISAEGATYVYRPSADIRWIVGEEK